MDLSSFDAQSARDVSLWVMIAGVVGVLVVLKFVSSIVSKLLLLALFGADRKGTRLNSSHVSESRMPSSA